MSERASKVQMVLQTILEKFINLSKATDTTISPSTKVYYKDYLALNSQYIYAFSIIYMPYLHLIYKYYH